MKSVKTLSRKLFQMLSAFLISLLFISNTFAGDDDNNISISRQKEYYVFDQENGEVVVRSTVNTIYHCNGFRTQVPVVEFYNDRSRIDNVDIYVSGNRTRAVKPTYEYYSVSDVFYSDARVCYFGLPLEKKDGESSVEFKKTITDPRYFTSVFFARSFIIGQKEIVIEIPKWMDVELKEMNFEGYKITRNKEYNSRSESNIYTYTCSQLPATTNEKMAPGPSHIYPHLLVLCKKAQTNKGNIVFFNSLQDQYNWYHNLVKQVGNDQQQLKTKAAAITTGLTSEEDKIKAIYSWVQENIRYIAFEDGIAGFKPDKAQEVLRKQYGDCKGMANLTKELLVGAGFDARLCWIGTNHIAYDYSTPNLAVDNHMICAVKWQGKFVFLDATETYIGLRQYANRIQGRQVLIENGDNYILEKIPVMPFTQNTETEKRKLKIEGELLTGSVEQVWSGESKEYLLSQAHNVKKEKLEDAFINYLSDGTRHYKITSFHLPDIRNWQSQVSLNYQVQQPNAVTVFGDDIYLDLDGKKEFSDFLIELTTRKTPIEFSYKRHIVQEITVTIPAGFKPGVLPAPVAIDRPIYSLNISYKVAGDQLIYKKEISFKESRLPVTAFKQWNEDIANLHKFYLEQITLSKK